MAESVLVNDPISACNQGCGSVCEGSAAKRKRGCLAMSFVEVSEVSFEIL